MTKTNTDDDRLRDKLVALEMKERLDAQEIKAQGAIIDGIGRMLEAGSMDAAFDALTQVLRQSVGATGVLVMGHAADRFFEPNKLKCDVLHCSVEGTKPELSKDLINWLKKRRNVSDAHRLNVLEPFTSAIPEMKSLVAVPFSDSHNEHGAILCFRDTVEHFSQHDLNIVRKMASHAAHAIRSVRLAARSVTLSSGLFGTSAGLMLMSPYDEGGEIVFANRAFLKLSGLKMADLAGTKFLSSGPTDEQDRLELRKAFQANRPGRFRVRNRMDDGSFFWNEINLNRIEDEHGELRYMLALHFDVTEQVESEARQRWLEEKFREFQANEGIGRLAASVAHDFNNLLAVINGNATLLKGDDNAFVASCADRIEQASSSAAKMINRFLDLTNVKQEFATVDLSNVVSESCDLLNCALGADVTLVNKLTNVGIPIHCNPQEILRVLLNLVQNAQDAVDGAGGTITQETERFDGSDLSQVTPQIGKIDATRSYARYRVSDDGCGMDASVLANLGRSIFTTKGARGSGIGLIGVAEIVEAHDGALSISSEVGVGTKVDVYLPINDKTSPAASKAEIGTVRLDGVLALVIDDDIDVSSVICTYLERLGAEVALCQDPRDAWDVLKDDSSQFSIILTDYSMPGLSGAQLAQMVGETDPDLPVIVITALARKLSDPLLDAENVRAVLGKPIELSTLAKLVSEQARQTVE